jgi:hypothetical protein
MPDQIPFVDYVTCGHQQHLLVHECAGRDFDSTSDIHFLERGAV